MDEFNFNLDRMIDMLDTEFDEVEDSRFVPLDEFLERGEDDYEKWIPYD